MTDRTQSQDDTFQSTDADRLLFDEVDTMVCTLDLHGRFVSLNPAGETLTGYAAADLVGRPAVELIPAELRDEAIRQFRSRLARTAIRRPAETMLVTRTGTLVAIEVASAVLRKEGRPVGLLGIVRDLTELQSDREVLHQSNERFRSAFESAAIGMAVVAPDGRFLQVNASLCELVGYTADELLTLTFEDITYPDDRATSVELVRRTLAGEIRGYHIEKRYLHKSGKVIWANLSVSLVRQSGGSPLYFISQIQDVSERQRAEETVAVSAAQLAEAQHIGHVGSWEWDIETGTLTWSEELFRIFGVDHDVGPMTYERYLETIHPEDRADVEATVAAGAQTGTAYTIEHRVTWPDGTIHWIHGRGEVIMGDHGPIRMSGTAQEITRRKAVEEQLRQAELRYRTLVEELPLTTYIRPLDLSLPNIYCSPQVEQLLGCTAEEWETNPRMFESMVHPDDRDRGLTDFRRVREAGTPLHEEYRYIARDGRVVWVLDKTYLVEDENGEKCVHGFLLDISERKRFEEERSRLQEELSQAQKLEALGRLAGGVAHDFNNMLTAITGYSELLLAQLDDDSPLRAETQQIRRAAEQASQLPRQLLAFSRNQRLEPRLIDLGDVIAAAADLLRRLAGEAIEVVVTSASSAPVVADPSQIEHVLVNLVLNARDAMPGGGRVTIETANVEIREQSDVERAVPPGHYVVLSVEDTGEGIDAETRARLFEPFFTTKPEGKGAGLGLASVFGIVTQSDGFVDVKSTPGRGSRFEVFLPRSSERRATAPATADQSPNVMTVPAPGTKTVLLAEDEEVVRSLVVTVLENAGFNVVVATNGVEALALWEATPGIDVLVSDMVMPGLGGRALADRILSSAPGTAVVFISGYTADDSIGTTRADDAPQLLRKPFTPSALVSAVATALQRSALREGAHRT